MKAKIIPAKKKKEAINLPKFLGHTGSEYATGADHWWAEREDKKKWKKIYNEYLEKDFRKQGVDEHPNPETGGSDFDYTVAHYEIASTYADKKLRKWWEDKVKKKR